MGVKHRNQADHLFAEGKYGEAMYYYGAARNRFERAGAEDEVEKIEQLQANFRKQLGR